jgi:hypothetical protein
MFAVAFQQTIWVQSLTVYQCGNLAAQSQYAIGLKMTATGRPSVGAERRRVEIIRAPMPVP